MMRRSLNGSRWLIEGEFLVLGCYGNVFFFVVAGCLSSLLLGYKSGVGLDLPGDKGSIFTSFN